ncbi:MAG: hypothetical protein IPL46_14355 [Saprospiraceae bacterium]|nr:hypothetical protein [Saprospiraceae bacterium]
MKDQKIGIVTFLIFVSGLSLPAQNNPASFIGTNHARGNNLLILRLAVSCPGEYTQQVDGAANAEVYINTWLAQINEMYGREYAVRFELIPNNNLLIYTDPGMDPWPNKAPGGGCDGGPPLMAVQAQVIDNIVGAANYDFSHIFYSDAMAGGCGGSYKSAISGPPAFDITRHEMGHQFQQSHTINNGGNNNYEPENAGRSVQGGNSDPYAHSASFHQLAEHILFTETGVGTPVITGNTIPTCNAGPDRFIPISTPFMLTATASDPDAGDNLTYAWDQLDGGFVQNLPPANDTYGALFSRLVPSNSPSRIYPKINSLITNNYSNAEEHLPTQPRDLNIRLTVNDNHMYNYNNVMVPASGINSDDFKITVVNDGGPFQVTSPNTAVAYAGGSNQTIAWAVNGTNLAPINTTEVKISLSTDGGLTFPIVLATNTPNDGSQLVAIPNINSTLARIKVEAVGNIYFDISNQDFTINQNPGLPGIKIAVSGINTQVSENGQIDSYDLSLLTNPTGPVTVTMNTDPQTQISLDGTNFSSSQTVMLSNMVSQSIIVRGKYDSDVEGPHFGSIAHVVSTTSDNTNYPSGLPGSTVSVNISDAQIPPVVGIDFDNMESTSVPAFWVKFTQVNGHLASNIPLDDGTPTNIDIAMTATNCGNGGCSFDFGNNSGSNNPQHVQPLDMTLGGVSVSKGTVQIVWSDLKPGTKYRVFVFASNIVNGPTNQTVTITGNGVNDPAPFLQSVAGDLLINDVTSTNDPLLSFGKIVTSTVSGTITIVVTAPDEIWISGLALQEVFFPPTNCLENITLMSALNTSSDFITDQTITSTHMISGVGVLVNYSAKTAINLNVGFEVSQGPTFIASNEGCNN